MQELLLNVDGRTSQFLRIIARLNGPRDDDTDHKSGKWSTRDIFVIMFCGVNVMVFCRHIESTNTAEHRLWQRISTLLQKTNISQFHLAMSSSSSSSANSPELHRLIEGVLRRRADADGDAVNSADDDWHVEDDARWDSCPIGSIPTAV